MSKLPQSIGLVRGVAIAVSMVIGSGILGLPGLALEKGNAQESRLAWILMIFLAIPMIALFTRLGTRFPSAGGLSRYAEEALGTWGGYAVSFVVAGTCILGVPACALIGGAYVQKLLGISETWIPLLAFFNLSIMTLWNLRGIKSSSSINNVAFVVIVFLILTLAFFHFPFIEKTVSLEWNLEEIRVPAMWSVSVLLFWAFLGWESLSFGLEEFKNPKRSISIVYWTSFLVVSFLYILLAFTSIGGHLAGLDVQGESGLVTLTQSIPFGTVLLVLMVVVLLASSNGWIFGFSRLFYAAGRQGIFPKFLAKLSQQRQTPTRSLLLLQGFYSLTLLSHVLLGWSISDMIALVNQNFLFLFALSILAYYKHSQGFSRWWISIGSAISILFLLSGFGVLVLYPVSLMLLGYLRYRYLKKILP